MDRADFYFRQLVTEAELDDAFDDAENALWNLAIDIGLLGVISGAEITETSPKSMNVYASQPCRGYDQLGRRIYYGPQQTVDCSQDEDGNPTIPSAGNTRYIMLKLEFDRNLSDLRTDGNGASVYYDRDEYFAIKVVAGAEVAKPGPPTPPSAPSDALILCDIQLDDTTTEIATTDVETTRRQDFQWTDADKIGVTAGSWTCIDSGSSHVQDALDSVDTELISRDATGDIDEDVLSDGTATLGASGDNWPDLYVDNVHVDTAIKAITGGETIGDASQQFAAHFSALTMYGDILGDANGRDLGNATERFDAFLQAATVYGSLLPSATGIDIGSAGARFDAFLEAATVYSSLTLSTALASVLNFSSAQSVTVMIPVYEFLNVAGTDWDWQSTRTRLDCVVAGRSVLIFFNLPHGVVLQSMRIRWAQVSGTGATAIIQSVDEDNAATSVGSSKTMTTIDGSVNWDVIDSSLSETINRGTTHYRVKVDCNDNQTTEVYMLEATYDVTDILKAACYNCA